ncbi:hypothetical protein KBJ98_04720 [Flavobacterium sp. F-328]|uniref:Uncharacterized protein n=2 Tax=Flavobacterium erciyesense TaxID=2825842 RepID=A0ABS5D1X4_9FLAO|nr:hypothetical protein [Flavobacterium erciyesense]
MGKETCECITKKKIDFSTISKNELQLQVGLCMIQSYSEHISEFSEGEKISLDDEAAMERLGEKVALKMLDSCPEIILEMGKASTRTDQEQATEKSNLFVEGQITAISKEQFLTIQLKDKNGRSYSFLVLDYFDTASLLTDNELKVKNEVKIGYSEIELLDVKANEFRYFKIINNIEKQ